MGTKIQIDLHPKLVEAINKIKAEDLPIELFIKNLVKSIVVNQLIREAQKAASQKKADEVKNW